MPVEELEFLYRRQVEELEATHPGWDALEVIEVAISDMQ